MCVYSGDYNYYFFMIIEYSMKIVIERTVNENKDKRGLACIICNDYLVHRNLDPLMGSDSDSEKMDLALKHVNFATIVRRNTEEIEIEALLNAFFDYTYPEAYSCFAIVFSGHGTSSAITSNDGSSVEMEKKIAYLIDSKQFNLPVLLFIDACREGDSRAISKPRNLLIAYSTRNRHSSSGDQGQGGYWIQELAKVIGELKTRTHIREIISSVNKKIIIEYGQSPEYLDSATDVYFSPRPS